MSQQRRLIILGRIDSLNKLIGSMNHNRYAGNGVKKRNTSRVAEQLVGEEPLEPHGNYSFVWHKCSKREDPDNIASAQKFVFDGLQEANLIPNDNWDYVNSIHHYFRKDVPSNDDEYLEVWVTW